MLNNSQNSAQVDDEDEHEDEKPDPDFSDTLLAGTMM